MAPPPVVLLDESTGRPVVLRPSGDRGAESLLCMIDGRPDEVALIPVQGGAYPPAAGKKVRALVAKRIDFRRTRIAAPTAVLRGPTDRTADAPVWGFVCPRADGCGLDELTSPAERRRLGLDPWGVGERSAAAVALVETFRAHERLGVRKADHNPPNWRYDARTGRFFSIDPLAFAFEHNGWHGTGVARPEAVAPESQRKLAAGTLAGEVIGDDHERFALAVLLFVLFCDGFPTDYAGAAADAVERKEFACVSAPAGARVSPAMQVAYFGIPAGLQSLVTQGLMNPPSQRPGPDKYLAELRAALPPPTPNPRRVWRWPFARFPLSRRQAAMGACLALMAAWVGLRTGGQPAAVGPLPTRGLTATQQSEQTAPRTPVDPDGWKTFANRVQPPASRSAADPDSWKTFANKVGAP